MTLPNEPIVIPTHVLVERLRGEIADNTASFQVAMGLSEWYTAQDLLKRMTTLVGILEAILGDEEEVVYS
jgi:hypothetical protein